MDRQSSGYLRGIGRKAGGKLEYFQPTTIMQTLCSPTMMRDFDVRSSHDEEEGEQAGDALLTRCLYTPNKVLLTQATFFTGRASQIRFTWLTDGHPDRSSVTQAASVLYGPLCS